MNKFLALLGFDPEKHSVKVEMMAGLITFLTMSYILAVNPMILGETGMDKGALFSATIVSAVIATLVMAFYAKMPFVLASGMGMNAFFAYTLVLMMGYRWQEALAAVFVEGVVFILLTAFRVREAIINAIPQNLRYSLSVGIGLFIVYIGLKNGGLIVANDANVTALGPNPDRCYTDGTQGERSPLLYHYRHDDHRHPFWSDTYSRGIQPRQSAGILGTHRLPPGLRSFRRSGC